MGEASPRQDNKPESKGFVAMVFGLNFMDTAKEKIAAKTSLPSIGRVKSPDGNI